MWSSRLRPWFADHSSVRRIRRACVPATVRLTLVGIVVALAGCGSTEEPHTTASSPKSTSADAMPSTDKVTALEGTWRTHPVTVDEMAQTLHAAGLGRSVRGFAENAPILDIPTVLILEVGDDWDLSGKARGRQPELIDYDAGYRVHGDEVVVTHSAGSNTFRWSVTGDVLELTWVKTTFEGGYAGVPEEAFQRALYMTADFHRDS